MLERTAIIINIDAIIVWETIAIVLAFPGNIFVIGSIIITYVIYNIVALSVSSYFRLVRKARHEWHLQKNIVPSFWLLSTNPPPGALKKLYRDMIENTLPTTLAKIPEGHTLVVITHLISPSVLKYLPLKPEYIEIKPSKLQKILASVGMWLSAVLRFILIKGWYKPKFHAWYKLSLKK